LVCCLFQSGGREALSFGNKHAKYFMVGSCQWSNLYPLFCIHAQPIAIQFDNQFPRQRRSHSVCRNQISASGLKSATPDGSLQESTNEQTFPGRKKLLMENYFGLNLTIRLLVESNQ
jgi:hypothetical protein